MQRPLRLLAALAFLAALSLASPGAQAGTQEAPEVSDLPDDQVGPGGQKTCPNSNACNFRNADIIAAWVDNETADSFQVNIEISGTAGLSASTQYTWNFRFKAGATDHVATAVVTAGVAHPTTGAPVTGGTLTFSGVASNGSVGNSLISMTVLKSAISATPGMQLGSLTADANGHLLNQASALVATDRAPDGTGFGSNYTLQGGAGGPTASDTDADGLNDTWEQTHFGGMAENATGDPDADGCDNRCEFASSTDPKKADTDGDGANDGDEIKAGTNPRDPASRPVGTTTTPPPPPPTTPPPTSPGPGDGGTGGNGGGTTPDDEDSSQRLSSGFEEGAFGIGYLILASALGAVVLLIALVGRFGRWRL